MQPNGGIGAGLTDEELEALHELLIEYLVYGNPGGFSQEDKDHLSNILTKVTNEAKVRKFWWAR